NLVDEFTMLCYIRHLRQASQHVDRAGQNVVGFQGIPEQRASIRLGNQPRHIIPMQGALEGSLQDLAFSAVVVDHPQAAVAPIISCVEGLVLFGDVRDLAADDEEGALLDLVERSGLQSHGLSYTILKFAANLFEQRLEGFEILAASPVGDLLRCLALRKGGNVAKARDINILLRNLRPQFSK